MKVNDLGILPPMIGVIHRHFEKSKPTVPDTTFTVTLSAPTDYLEFVCPDEILRNIEEIEILYRKGGVYAG